jgi:hypothetical protein
MYPPAGEEYPTANVLHARSYGSSTADPKLAPAADASALVMVALIFFLLGCLAALAFTLYRRSLRPRPWHADLTDPSPQHPATQMKLQQGERLAAWERQPDWWK